VTAFDIVPAEGAADIEQARALFLEYGESLNFSLCFQGFDEELATLPGAYAPPGGCLLLARAGAAVAGVVAARPLDREISEMKRLYVRPAYLGRGLGRRLAEAAIAAAHAAGYRKMRLDTVPGQMDAAIALYRSLGFVDIPPYYVNPLPEAIYLECDLRARTGR